MRFHKNMALLALEQAAGMAALYAAYFVGLYFPRWLNIALAVLLGACAFIGYLICSEKEREDGLFLFPVIFSLAAGLSVAAYFCRVGNNFSTTIRSCSFVLARSCSTERSFLPIGGRERHLSCRTFYLRSSVCACSAWRCIAFVTGTLPRMR